MRIEPTDALIIVDIQKDFCAGGALAVPDGDAVVDPINAMLPKFNHVVCTRDWHPANHCSFDATPQFVDGSWPAHCVADTPGAAFHESLHVPENTLLVSKGTDSHKEAYSSFDGTDLAEALSARGVKRIFVCGLATNYCVMSTALDGLKAGFSVVLIEDACRGIDVPEGTVAKAVQAMEQAGVTLCSSGELI
jgi:nicotinamidase/pyrazinamidase